MEQLITRADVCRILQISLSTVDRMIRDGDLRPIRIGRSVRFLQKDVEGRVKQWQKN